MSDGLFYIFSEQVEEGWWSGCLNNKSGLFPSNFVKELDPSGEDGESNDTAADETGRRETLVQHVCLSKQNHKPWGFLVFFGCSAVIWLFVNHFNICLTFRNTVYDKRQWITYFRRSLITCIVTLVGMELNGVVQVLLHTIWNKPQQEVKCLVEVVKPFVFQWHACEPEPCACVHAFTCVQFLLWVNFSLYISLLVIPISPAGTGQQQIHSTSLCNFIWFRNKSVLMNNLTCWLLPLTVSAF